MSDAAAFLDGDWGTHAFGTLTVDTWPPSTKKLIESGRISISPLALLTSAATVMLLDKMETNAIYRKNPLRGDNTTVCNAANTGIAYGPAMRFALRIFVGVCKVTRTKC